MCSSLNKKNALFQSLSDNDDNKIDEYSQYFWVKGRYKDEVVEVTQSKNRNTNGRAPTFYCRSGVRSTRSSSFLPPQSIQERTNMVKSSVVSTKSTRFI